MRMKMFYFLACFLCMLLAVSCDSNESEHVDGVQTSKLCAYGVAKTRAVNSDNSNMVFSDDNIEWFNPVTREVKFRGVEPSVDVFPVYSKIEFRNGSKSLFTASSFVTSLNNQIFDSLVIYYNVETGKYYLDDCYPNTPEIRNREIVQKNILERKVNWQEFLDVLNLENKLK